MKPQITVVGSVNMDLVFRAPRMPAIGETLNGHEFHQVPGGKGANQAVAAARQGAQVSFIGAVGDDGFAEVSRNCLLQDGISINFLKRVEHCATGVAGILVDDQGHNCIVLAAGANQSVDIAQIDAASAAITSADYLICQLEIPLASVTHAIALAHQAGVKIILNPAPAQNLSAELLKQIDYLILNETEAALLSGIAVTDQNSAIAACQNLLSQGVSSILLTMGEHGVLTATSAGYEIASAIRVEVVDTTAAGDTFVGAFAVGMANGLNLSQAVSEAQYTAALTVTKLGAQTSIPQRREVLEFMQSTQNKA